MQSGVNECVAVMGAGVNNAHHMRNVLWDSAAGCFPVALLGPFPLPPFPTPLLVWLTAARILKAHSSGAE